ncbi:hypothetical protein H4S01_003005 [Coemansia sp. RSA 2610]|nr:hypothetical protein H4S01_003005 [Coemansia sp. RSA 2610]
MESFLAAIPELCDDDRRAFLYSDLGRQQNDNPDGYREAQKFWTDLLLRACRQGLLSPAPSSDDAETASVLCIERGALAARFAFRGDTPEIDCVIDDLQRRGTLTTVGELLAGNIARRWAGRLALQLPLVGRPAAALAWGAAEAHVLAAQPLVSAAATRVLDTHYAQVACTLTDNLMSMGEFQRRFAQAITGSDTVSLLDARLICRSLEDMQRVTTAQTDGHVLVKFAAARAQRVRAVTEADRCTFHVIETQTQIVRQVTQLEQRASDLDSRAREAVRLGHRTLALSHLRLKRHIEGDVLAKRTQALQNIEHVVLQLQQAASDAQAVKAFAAGTQALRGLNQQTEAMDPQRVFDDWAEQASRAAEVQEVMQDSVADISEDFDEDELEAELDALVAAAEPPKTDEQKAAEDKDADMLADALTKVTIDNMPSAARPEIQAADRVKPVGNSDKAEKEPEAEPDQDQVAIPAE